MPYSGFWLQLRGSVLWIGLFVLAGYFFATAGGAQESDAVMLGIIIISILPAPSPGYVIVSGADTLSLIQMIGV